MLFSVLRSFLSVPANKQDGQRILHRGMGGGVNRSRKRWGTHSLTPKKIKKNKFSPWLNS
nr:MAG TPA: hypothetical protein [Caudoviricetes sp.]